MTPRILLIVVNYHTPACVAAYCKAVRRQASPETVAIAVADNSSCFEKPEHATLGQELASLAVSICEPGENLGYFGGAGFVHQSLVPGFCDPDWAIVSNCDIDFRDDKFFERLLAFDRPRAVMGIGPDIIRMHRGADPEAPHYRENPMRVSRLSRWDMWLRIIILGSRLLTEWTHKYARWRRNRRRTSGSGLPEAGPVYMIHGSFIILHREYFAVTKKFAHPSFLFGEEIFLAEEVRRAGGKLWFEPSLKLEHVGGETTDLIPSDQRRRLILQSLKRLTEEYFSAG